MKFEAKLTEILKAALYHYGASTLESLSTYFEADDTERSKIHLGLLELYDDGVVQYDSVSRVWSLNRAIKNIS